MLHNVWDSNISNLILYEQFVFQHGPCYPAGRALDCRAKLANENKEIYVLLGKDWHSFDFFDETGQSFFCWIDHRIFSYDSWILLYLMIWSNPHFCIASLGMLVYISLPWYPASPFLGPAFLAKLQEKPSPPQLLPYNPPHVLAALKSLFCKTESPRVISSAGGGICFWEIKWISGSLVLGLCKLCEFEICIYVVIAHVLTIFSYWLCSLQGSMPTLIPSISIWPLECWPHDPYLFIIYIYIYTS